MELVSKPKLISLPLTGCAHSNKDIAACLREQADWMEEENANELRNVYLVIERADGSIYRQTIGQHCDVARAIGVITMACIQDALK